MKNRLTLVFAFLLIVGFLSSALIIPSKALANKYLQSHDSNNLWLKDGSYNAPWEILLNNAQGISYVTGTDKRIGYTDSNGTFWVKDGSKNSPWIQVATNVWEGHVVQDNIYIVSKDFKLFAKQGDIRSSWIQLHTGVFSIEASANRIAALVNYDGSRMDLSVKESLFGPWTTIATPSATYTDGTFQKPSVAVSSNRVAYIPGDFSGFYMKEGSIRSSWDTNVWGNNAFSFKMNNNRLCVSVAIEASSRVYCKDGPLFASWVLAKNNAFVSDVTDNKIAVADNSPGTSVSVLEGSLSNNSGWKIVDNTGWLVFSH